MPTAGTLHHVEINVSSLQESLRFWEPLLSMLGYAEHQNWHAGRSYILNGTYLVFVQASDLEGGFNRRGVGLNHLAFLAGAHEQVDTITKWVRTQGYRVLYENAHPYAGGATHYALYCEWRTFKNQRSHVTKAGTVIFRSQQIDCATCSMKGRCCPNTSFRKIARSVHEAARDVARRIAKTPQYVCSRHERKKVEMLFAHLKRILKLDRLRLRGVTGANDEFTLAAAVQNLRRLAKLTSQGPPTTG